MFFCNINFFDLLNNSNVYIRKVYILGVLKRSFVFLCFINVELLGMFRVNIGIFNVMDCYLK